MTLPFAMIQSLDRSLKDHGETVTLRRRVGNTSTFVELSCKAKVMGYASDTLIADIKQTFSTLILSPSEIDASTTWPGAAGGSKWPRIGDFIKQSEGVDRKVEAVRTKSSGDSVVRIEMKVLG
jgi:hypothetical protein